VTSRNLNRLIAIFVIVGVAAALIVGIRYLQDKPAQQKKLVQQVSIVQPPPPPEIQKPLEQQIEEVDIPEPEDALEEIPDPAMDDLPPVGDQLGLDADGGAGGDTFGLLGKKGGRGLLDGANPGREYAWYTSALQNDITEFLLDIEGARQQKYSIIIKLWINDDGSIQQYRLVKSSGNPSVDNAIQLAFNEQPKFSEKPPRKMPQPIKLKITSRI